MIMSTTVILSQFETQMQFRQRMRDECCLVHTKTLMEPPKKKKAAMKEKSAEGSSKKVVAESASSSIRPPVPATAEVTEPQSSHVTEGQMTRKEKRRAHLKASFEKKLQRHNTREARIEELASKVSDKTQAAAIVDSRHNPKHFAGAFWKKRKDEKRRTLFIGNLPGSMTQEDVIDLIASSLASSGEVKEGVQNEKVVERVDFLALGQKKARNAYAVCASVEVAERVMPILNNYEIDRGQWLRCNFSADKEQRSIAISKRPITRPFTRPSQGRGRGRR